jgi:E3 ubiquitin-protein ligase MARCH6
VALIVTILNLSMGLGVWIPYTVGKTASLMLVGYQPGWTIESYFPTKADPWRLVELANYPILMVRYMTDPIVDSIVEYIHRVAPKLVSRPEMSLDSLGQPLSVDIPAFSSILKSYISHYANFDRALPPAILAILNHRVLAAQHFMNISFANIAAKYTSFIYGDSGADRSIAIAIGYVSALWLAGLYLLLTSPNHLDSASRAARLFLKQQMIVLKVSSLIFPFHFQFSCIRRWQVSCLSNYSSSHCYAES